MKRSLLIITILAINILLISSAFARLNITILNDPAGYYSGNFCEDEDTVYFTVGGFDSECACRRAEVYLVRGSRIISSEWVDEGETGSFYLSSLGGLMQLRAWCTCGSQSGFISFNRDTSAPTFTEVHVGSGTLHWAHDPVFVWASGFSDDGYWRFSEYTTLSWLDGRYQGSSRGDGFTYLYGVDEGRHTVQIGVEDKCGHRSRISLPVEFHVDNRAPSVYFIAPEESARISRNNYFTVQIAAGDPGFDLDKVSGISSVKLYLDDLPGEFSEGQYLGTFPGPWMTFFSTRSSLTVRANWNLGSHKLIVIAEDVAGNQRRIERPISITLSYPYIPWP